MFCYLVLSILCSSWLPLDLPTAGNYKSLLNMHGSLLCRSGRMVFSLLCEASLFIFLFVCVYIKILENDWKLVFYHGFSSQLHIFTLWRHIANYLFWWFSWIILNQNQGMSVLNNAIEACKEEIERHKGRLVVKEAPRTVSLGYFSTVCIISESLFP